MLFLTTEGYCGYEYSYTINWCNTEITGYLSGGVKWQIPVAVGVAAAC